jgi:hypothetical protein
VRGKSAVGNISLSFSTIEALDAVIAQMELELHEIPRLAQMDALS